MRSVVKQNANGTENDTRAPTAEDFSPPAVKRFVALQALKHPATIYPIAGLLLSAAHGFINGEPTAFFVGFLCGTISVGSFIYNFFFRGEKIAGNHISELRTQMEHSREQAANELKRDCSNADFDRGAEAVRKLTDAYQKLKEFLTGDNVNDRDSENAQTYISQAEDAYQEGLNLLRQAFDVHVALQGIDTETLDDERHGWEKEMALLKKPKSGNTSDPIAAAKVKTLEAKIGSHTRRIESIQGRTQLLEELLAQCEECEGGLDVAHLELVDLLQSGDAISLSSHQLNGMTRLEQTVAALRKVENKLNNLSHPDTSAEDARYRKIADETKSH